MTTEVKNAVATIQKDITDEVNTKLAVLQKDGLVLPPNYSPSNALKSAFFKLQEVKDRNNKPALEVCTKSSIANALLDMTVQGLNPSKTQCYFIVYGSELQLNRSYFGTQTVMKRLSTVKDVYANVIYQDDKFVYENRKGRDYLVSHETCLENRDKEIIGAYAIVETSDGDMPMTVMSRKEIETSWSQSKTGGAVHKKFPQEMAKRTVINRAAKTYVNTSDDSDILIETINKTTSNEFEDDRIDKENAMDVEVTIKENANKEEFKLPLQETPKTKKEASKIVEKPEATIVEKEDGTSKWNLV